MFLFYRLSFYAKDKKVLINEYILPKTDVKSALGIGKAANGQIIVKATIT